jgi:hypothetical protein
MSEIEELLLVQAFIIFSEFPLEILTERGQVEMA